MRVFVPVVVSLCAAGFAVAQENSFNKTLYPVLEKAACRSCHNVDGVASATRLQFPEADAPPAKLEAFGRSLVSLVDRTDPANSILIRKPTARVAHAGGIRIKPGSAEEKVLQDFVARLAKMPPSEVAEALKYREREASGEGYERTKIALRRLTHSQYNNVVRDLLGDTSMPANQFPPEDFVNGFKTQYQAQSISPLLMESYSAAAEKLARNAFRGGDSHQLIPCKTADAACRAKFVKSFGLKTFRRPLQLLEQKRYETLMAREPDLIKGAQLVVETMLQSPNFLFRLDETDDPALKPYATANRLAFALWDTMPDTALLDAARRGELSTGDGVQKSAARLIADNRAHQNLDEFLSQWLRFDRVIGTTKDRRQFPKFNREAAVAMTEETRRFFGDLVWSDRNFMDFFTGDYGFMTPDLASIYDLPVPSKEYDRVKFTPESERAGILGQALFLTMTAKQDDTSPTARGLFVREHFLCQHVPPPPAGVNTNLPPLNESKPLSNRERLSAHTTDSSCAGCHKLIDPIGFGFEKFDAIGGRREKATLMFSRVHSGSKPKTAQVDLDTTGFVAGIPNSNFSSPRELGSILAKAPGCQECVVKQFFRYTVGRLESPADRPLIDHVVNDFKASQFKFKELMISLVVQREAQGKLKEGASSVARNHPPR